MKGLAHTPLAESKPLNPLSELHMEKGSRGPMMVPLSHSMSYRRSPALQSLAFSSLTILVLKTRGTLWFS